MPTEARTTTDPPIPSVNQAFTTKFLKWTFNFNTNKNFYIDSFESNSLDEFRTFKNDADQLEIQNKQVLLLLISIDAFRIGFDLKTTKELLELYFFKVNSIFPIIEEHTFWSDYERGIFPNVILYGMILAVSTDKLAEEIFIANCVLERNDTTNTKILELCSKLDLKTRTLLTVLPDLGDDNTFARFLTYLLLLMNTGYNVFGIEKSQSDLAEAIRLSKALEINEKDGSISKGLFISNSTNKKFCKSTYSQNLWWTCYVFDKLNSFIHCKPTLIHNGDFNLDRPMYGFLLMLIDDCDKIEISSLSTLSELENFVKDEFSKNVNDFDRFSCFKEDSIDLVPSELYLPNVLLSTYKKNMSYFFKRMLKLIQITSVHKSFSNEIEVTGFSNNINNIVASSVSNLLRYVKHINTKEIISIHWVPGALCFGLLTMLNISDIARKTKTDDSILVSYYICIKDVTKELKTRFDSKWWFAKETISISNVLVQLLYGSNNNIRAAKSNEINFNNLIVLTNSTSNSGTPGPSETQSILSSTPTSNYDDLQPSDDSIKRTGLGMDNPMQKVKIASLLSTDDIVENKNNFTRGDSNERVNICEKRSN